MEKKTITKGKLWKIRQEKGYTLEYVSSIVGITKQALSRCELGISFMKPENAKKVAEVYGLKDWRDLYDDPI